MTEDARHEVPPPDLLPRTARQRPAPYIYMPGEVAALVAVADRAASRRCRVPGQCRLLFGLIAATGMRISEALGLAYVDLYSETQRFYCGAGHPLFDRDDATIDIGEVRQHGIVGRAYWGSRDLKMFAISAPRAVVSDMEAEARLILSGRFLGYLPEHFARQFVESGRMRAIRSELFSYEALFQIAHDPANARGPVVAMMIRAVLTEMGRA